MIIRISILAIVLILVPKPIGMVFNELRSTFNLRLHSLQNPGQVAYLRGQPNVVIAIERLKLVNESLCLFHCLKYMGTLSEEQLLSSHQDQFAVTLINHLAR